MTKAQHIAAFTEMMWEWYRRHKRVLPWRDLKIKDDTQRAYLVLVSEIMLQQTQVPRVEIMFKKFIRTFPSLEALAHASNRDVILAWRGMGYNSRALRLRDAAKKIVQYFGLQFPQNMEELLSIKGIGPYTAAAVRNFAFNLPTPCLDTNIRRILHRVFIGPERRDGTWRKNDKYLLKLAGEVLDIALLSPTRPARGAPSPTLLRSSGATEGQAGGGQRRRQRPPPLGGRVGDGGKDWHAALMDFGSLVCTKNNPKCQQCPLRHRCTSVNRVKPHRSKLKAGSSKLREPGREIAGKFVPNRIIRGRIVEELRDAPKGLALNDIGGRVCIDWDAKEHREWLHGILEKLKRDALIRSEGKRLMLAE
ncbi:MAG: hypothetical protein PHW10_05265 [Candidatus Peribacteraceae bacterium]|nr:hypothetical protein [Candidatus Peribacteraceae bacterium]